MNLNDNSTLLVMSCDKYQTAWLPYFSLIKKFWPEHPSRIMLATDTFSYSDDDLQIECMLSSPGDTWSMRLKRCLEKMETDYLFFSLEDFFVQAPVKQNRIDECFTYMEKHPDVAVCRLKTSTNPDQVLGEEIFPDFFIAGANVDYRLETQFALWRKDALLSFIDESEDPWEFEEFGTKRIVDTPLRFLWYKHPEGDKHLEKLIFPYMVGTETGYGINWGKWLWKNKKLFEKNGIDADFSALGTMGPIQIWYKRFFSKAVYQKNNHLPYLLFRLSYRIVNKIQRILKSGVS